MWAYSHTPPRIGLYTDCLTAATVGLNLPRCSAAAEHVVPEPSELYLVQNCTSCRAAGNPAASGLPVGQLTSMTLRGEESRVFCGNPQLLAFSKLWIKLIHLYLVRGLNPSEKYQSIGMIIPKIWENKNVPNHQPVINL